MTLNIYNKDGNLKLTVSPADSSTHQHGIQEDNVLNLSFTIPEYVLLDVNDYIEFDGARYWMIEQYTPAQKSTIEWSYSPKFYGIESLIRRGLVLKLVDKEMLPEFALTAPAYQHMELIVDNINRIFGTTDFKLGEVVSSDNIHIDYNGTYITDALSQLADKAGSEWWFDKGFTLNLTRCEYGEEISLGYRNGLTKLERTTANNVKFFTRLYPLGSTRNIVYSTYGHTRLQLPDGQKFIDQYIDKYGVIEHYEEKAFSDIYPRRIGEISSVRSEEKTGQDGKPFEVYYFKDDAMPFDPNDYKMDGLIIQVTFASGELIWRDFEVHYNSDKKEFEITTKFPDEVSQLPNDILTPKPGDKYILSNLKMPESYIREAEQELKEAVDLYMKENDRDKSVYKAQTDYIDIATRGIKLSIGQCIRLESEQFFPVNGYRSSRITKITRKINLPTQMDVEISDVLSKGKITTLENSVNEIRTIIEANKAALPQIIKSYENTTPADTNLFSALRSMLEFINKKGDVATGVIQFLQGWTAGREIIDSMIAGRGILADANGRLQVDRVEVRGSLHVLDLIINEIHAMAGDFSFSDSGAIERVENLGSNTYRLWMRKDTEFDFTTLDVNDVMFSIINTIKTGGNDYYTSWFRCLAKNVTDNTLTVLLYPDNDVPGGVNYPPIAGYNVTRRGSSYTPVDGTHNERQDSWLISSREGRIMFLQNVFKPILEDYNYALTIGRFPNIQAIKNLPISDSDTGIYAKIGVFERLYQTDYNGDIIPNEVMRGDWSALVAASQSPYRRVVNVVDTPNGSKTNVMEIHAVYHLGCKWHCLIDKTLEEPGWNVPGWLFVEGDKEYAIDFLSSNGYQFIAGSVNTVVTARFYYGRIDITDKVMSLAGSDVQWTRDTGNIPEDNSWKPTFDGAKNKLTLTSDDMGTNWMTVRKAMFICKVFIPIGEEYKIAEASFPFNI